MKNTPRSRLVLIELIFDLCIFALCAVVCVSVLVYARTMSRDSTELTDAVYLAQTVAEEYRAGVPISQGAADGGYTLQLEKSGDGSPIATITVLKDGRMIYTLEVAVLEEVAPS